MPTVNENTINEPEPGSQTAAILKDRRFKLSRACDRCRRRRIKCDEGHPCQACSGSNSDCTFEETGKRSNPHKAKRTTTLEDRLKQLESLIDAIPPSVFAAVQANGYDGPTPASIARQPLPTAAMNIPVANPAGHFASGAPTPALPNLLQQRLGPRPTGAGSDPMDLLTESMAKVSLAPPSMFYVDGSGHTRWNGETSGMPLLDFLVDSHAYRPPFNPHVNSRQAVKESESGSTTTPTGTSASGSSPSGSGAPEVEGEGSPEVIWKTITSVIPAELMDDLVRGFLSTSYYLLPFLHLPSFLHDYSSPSKWSDLGFATFIVSLCCISSLHIDNPSVRQSRVGLKWFELFTSLRSLPGSDRPTLYTIQGVFIGAVFAIGQGMVSRALTLMAEAVTLSMDAGIHRSADAYDWFDPVEDQVRKRTFWCIYMWDKQASAQFGRPPMIRLRDCDIDEPAAVDDEHITIHGLGVQPPDVPSRMGAFVALCRLAVVMDAVLDTPPSRTFTDAPNSFLNRATRVIGGAKRNADLREEEALLNEVVRSISPHWTHSPETLASDDVVRVTQAERLHCFEYYIRMLIYRHRFSVHAAARVAKNVDMPKSDAEKDAIRGVHHCGTRIVQVHLNIAARGFMTYYGIHVVHQLTQTGRSMVATFLEARHDESLKNLVPSILENLRSTFSLLRHFSGRYVCGMRATDMMEEICYLTQIPLNIPAHLSRANTVRGKWVNHIRKKHTPARPSVPAPQSPSSMLRSHSDAFAQSQNMYNHSPDGSNPISASSSFGPMSDFSSASSLGGLSFNSSAMSMAAEAISPDTVAMGANAFTYPGSGAMLGDLGSGMGAFGSTLGAQVGVDDFLAFFSENEAGQAPAVDFSQSSNGGMSGMSTGGM